MDDSHGYVYRATEGLMPVLTNKCEVLIPLLILGNMACDTETRDDE